MGILCYMEFMAFIKMCIFISLFQRLAMQKPPEMTTLLDL